MKNHHKDFNGPSEDELVRLLSSLRVKPVQEADFESRFLHDLHQRIAREAVCKPARVLLWEHVKQFFANIGVRKLAFGMTTVFVAAFIAVSVMVPQPEGVAKPVASVNASAELYSSANTAYNKQMLDRAYTFTPVEEVSKFSIRHDSVAEISMMSDHSGMAVPVPAAGESKFPAVESLADEEEPQPLQEAAEE